MAKTFIDEKNRSKEEVESLEVAEAAREEHWTQPSFVADLFMGKVQNKALFPYPFQEENDKKIGDAFCAKVEAFMKKVDTEKIDREGKIPDDVMKGLAELGCFGMKIPKEYGGLGLSQVNYSRALSIISSFCASTAATLSAHQSIGVPQPLLLFGTEEQKKKYLPQFAKGAVSAFALTEPEVGSDPARLSTVATPIDNGNSYLLNGTKLWCTNGAIADIMVVMAQTPAVTVNGREKKQITAFIVEKSMPGFRVVHRCRFMGLNGVQNALLEFKDVKVPKENIIWGTGKGLKLALITLNAGRLSIPAGTIGGIRNCLAIAREWGNERKQWGAAIGRHEPGAHRIAEMSATLMAMEAITWLAAAWVDNETQDIRLEAAMSKLFCTMRSHYLIDETLQMRAGRGYETGWSLRARGEKPWPIEQWLRDSRINQIVEGTNDIMRLFISREALDKHLGIAGDLLNPKVPIGRKITTFFKATAFYAFWYPRQWLSFYPWPLYSGLGPLGCWMRYVKRTAHRLARSTFHQMVKHGPKLEKKQMQLGRLVDIATDLFAMAATIGRAHAQKEAHAKQIAAVFCREARERIEANFRQLSCNSDKAHNQLAARVLDGQLLWQETSR